jgi:hypothetical protein
VKVEIFVVPLYVCRSCQTKVALTPAVAQSAKTLVEYSAPAKVMSVSTPGTDPGGGFGGLAFAADDHFSEYRPVIAPFSRSRSAAEHAGSGGVSGITGVTGGVLGNTGGTVGLAVGDGVGVAVGIGVSVGEGVGVDSGVPAPGAG